MKQPKVMERRFHMVDVFAQTPFSGNPLPVVVDSEGLTTEDMQQITAWFNQSETTFLLPPENPAADYRVRIFTLQRELPFAGHPTLGTCAVWQDESNTAKQPDSIVQECGAGLISIRQQDSKLAFAAPPLLRSGTVDPQLAQTIIEVLGIEAESVIDMAWADNGPGWVAVQVENAEAVLALQPLSHHASRLDIGVVGLYSAQDPYAYEVRAIYSDAQGNLREDPVTGSLNASLAQWLLARGRVSTPYIARQGTCVGRKGIIHVSESEEEIWISGEVQRLVSGTITC